MKVFIYTDPNYELDEENVFISGAYKSLSQFKRENPDLKPIVQYDLDELVASLEQSKKEYKKGK